MVLLLAPLFFPTVQTRQTSDGFPAGRGDSRVERRNGKGKGVYYYPGGPFGRALRGWQGRKGGDAHPETLSVVPTIGEAAVSLRLCQPTVTLTRECAVD